MSQRTKIVIAGGGSGGHLFPALSIADALVEQGIEKDNIIFFGSKYTLEKDVVPENGYRIILFGGRGVNKIKAVKNLAKNVFNVLGLIAAFFKSLYLLYKIKPALVVGVGGFASFPAMLSAYILRIKIVVHEQNSVLGRINKIAQKLGATVITTFSKVDGVEKPIHLGLPLRKEVISVISSGVEKSHSGKIITIFGGSLGARVINNAVIEMSNTKEAVKNWEITLIAGPKNIDAVDKSIGDNNFGIKILPFVTNLFELILRSDLVVSRAGAGSCVELEVAKVQSVLIPLALAPGDHQTKNASDLAASGQAVILKEENLNGESLFNAIREGLEKSEQELSSAGSIHLTADKKIAEYIISNYMS